MSSDQKVQITRADYIGKIQSSDDVYACECSRISYIRLSYKYCPYCGKELDWKAVAYGK